MVHVKEILAREGGQQFYNIKITIDDISYTINKSKIGSYHYSIPKYYASTTKLKEIHENNYIYYNFVLK